MVNILPFGFEQGFGPFTILLVKGSSENEPFRHLPNHVVRSPLIQKYISY